ncbi:Peptidase inhibitor 16 [Channa argus]|uniref:Peptidase inhibitor 16 n=1 Tax=Channa argus TaxID=215402 RepID=A0A6G1Q180_CHAAH|nr:Peptidase inhibitor 16 [Channa argus]KAK2898158.1 hypothetical protein Q8A73_014538 [Channa argus]
MDQCSHSEFQGVSPQHGVSSRWTTQDRASGNSRLRRGSGRLCLCLERGAPFWVWLLLGSLVVPGAWSFLSEEQEELLVELHNHYRGQVSPSAAAMMPLKWDPGLKLIAEGYAAKCIWNHNPDLEDTGENLYVGTGSLDLAVALEKWFLEHLDYDFQNNSCDEDKMCGHYTQMVWADTHKVGCAFHLCSSMEGLDWERVSFLVCNYYPAGNYEGERPYVEGDWCFRCPENLQKCENNLCVADTVEEDEEDRTGLPHLETYPVSVQPEEEGQEPHTSRTTTVQPLTTATPTTASTLSTITNTTSNPTVNVFEDNMPSATPTVGTRSSKVPLTTKVPLITQGEEPMPEEKVEEEKITATIDKTEGENILDTNTEEEKNSASVSSPSLLSAALTAILLLRP